MKAGRILPVLFALPLLAVLICIGVVWANQLRLYSPSPEMESAFFRRYSIQPTIDAYKTKGQFVQAESGTSAGAGPEFVTNTRTVEPTFAIFPENSVALMVGLRDNLAEQLAGSRAEILDESGDVLSGFRLRYRLGKSVGTATISPMAKKDRALSGMSPPQGMEDVSVQIAISEKWFPREPTSEEARLALR